MNDKIIEFLRKKDFKLLSELGNGAFGRTVLLQDEDIGHKFVCKKYSPISSIDPKEFYANFVNEIKLLHLIYHKNIVRIFNYYLYPEKETGYIMMEYIDGYDIYKYIEKYPEELNSVFEQIIEGFCYLEDHNILHRDIRPTNILVDNTGNVKIIDFGFGKKIHFSDDNEKSISINWWGDERPYDFKNQIYDHKTEIYFVGKLFEDLIMSTDASFKYTSILKRMIELNPTNRIASFLTILQDIQNNNSIDSLFNFDEKNIYKEFARVFSNSLVKRQPDAKINMDIQMLSRNLETLQKNTMLEDYISSKHILKLFIKGGYSYNLNSFNIEIFSEFSNLFRFSSKEKQNIILYNLLTRFEDIPEDLEFNNEIPF